MTNEVTTATTNERPWSASQPINEFHAMYDSEIDFVIAGLWDGDIDWYLGNGPSVADQVDAAKTGGRWGNAPDLERALVDMTNAARKAYPDSHFTRTRPTDIAAPTTAAPFDAYVRKLAELAGCGFQIHFDPTINDPYTGAYSVYFDDGRIGYSGYTPEQAVHEATCAHLPWTVVEDADGTWKVMAGNPVTADPLLGFEVGTRATQAQADALVAAHQIAGVPA